MPPVYEYDCGKCQTEVVLIVNKDDRDNQACPDCSNSLTRVYRTMPGVTRASYIDSSKTARGKEFSDLKQAAKLEQEAFNLPPTSAERLGLLKESKERKKI